MEDAKKLVEQQGKLLLEAFDRAAQKWGWESDQGNDQRSVTRAMTAWRRSKKNLEKYLLGLEVNRQNLLDLIAGRDKMITDLRAAVREYQDRG